MSKNMYLPGASNVYLEISSNRIIHMYSSYLPLLQYLSTRKQKVKETMLGNEKLQEIKTLCDKELKWFTLEDSSNKGLSYTTREHGDVAEETPGAQDIVEARRVRKLLKEKFPFCILDIEVTDEWVTLIIEVP